MQPFALLIAAVLCTGCTVTRERAATIATREVAGRRVPLPSDYTLRVEEGRAFVEFEPTVALWVATFGAPGRERQLYTVDIDRRNGAVRGFTDYRSVRLLRRF